VPVVDSGPVAESFATANAAQAGVSTRGRAEPTLELPISGVAAKFAQGPNGLQAGARLGDRGRRGKAVVEAGPPEFELSAVEALQVGRNVAAAVGARRCDGVA
jgi:hypothetical protein